MRCTFIGITCVHIQIETWVTGDTTILITTRACCACRITSLTGIEVSILKLTCRALSEAIFAISIQRVDAGAGIFAFVSGLDLNLIIRTCGDAALEDEILVGFEVRTDQVASGVVEEVTRHTGQTLRHHTSEAGITLY